MSKNKKVLRCITALFCLLLSHFALAQSPSECIETVNKTAACEHLIVKIADPRILRTSNTVQSPVCICLSDFPSVFAENPSQLLPEPSVEEKLVLDTWQLSLSELSQLLRY